MASRMQRYYEQEGSRSRSQKNKELYKDIYEYGEYSNIEGIASIGKANEIDITKIKELLNSRENYQKRREYRQTVDREPERYEEEPYEQEVLEDKNYDIRDILVKAKEVMPKDDKERVLRDNKYKDLIKLKKEPETPTEEDLKELINTITSTSMLNKIGDTTLAHELFSDLAPSENTKKGDPKSLKEYMAEAKREVTNTNENSLDKSFFTSSLNLSRSDFVDGEEKEKKTSVFSKIIITLLVIVILGCIGIIIYKRFMWSLFYF